MYHRLRPDFQWAVTFAVILAVLRFFYLGKLNQLQNSSQLVITIKYLDVGRTLFWVFWLKKNYVPKNMGPLNYANLQQNKWKYTDI